MRSDVADVLPIVLARESPDQGKGGQDLALVGWDPRSDQAVRAQAVAVEPDRASGQPGVVGRTLTRFMPEFEQLLYSCLGRGWGYTKVFSEINNRSVRNLKLPGSIEPYGGDSCEDRRVDFWTEL